MWSNSARPPPRSIVPAPSIEDGVRVGALLVRLECDRALLDDQRPSQGGCGRRGDDGRGGSRRRQAHHGTDVEDGPFPSHYSPNTSTPGRGVLGTYGGETAHRATARRVGVTSRQVHVGHRPKTTSGVRIRRPKGKNIHGQLGAPSTAPGQISGRRPEPGQRSSRPRQRSPTPARVNGCRPAAPVPLARDAGPVLTTLWADQPRTWSVHTGSARRERAQGDQEATLRASTDGPSRVPLRPRPD
jgi:hypothetical protein